MDEITAAARRVGIAAQTASSVERGFRRNREAGIPVRVLICGSLHLAGVVLADNG